MHVQKPSRPCRRVRSHFARTYYFTLQEDWRVRHTGLEPAGFNLDMELRNFPDVRAGIEVVQVFVGLGLGKDRVPRRGPRRARRELAPCSCEMIQEHAERNSLKQSLFHLAIV